MNVNVSYDRGQRTPNRPFPIAGCLSVVVVVAMAGLAAMWFVARQETTEIRNAPPVTRIVTVPKQ